mmetsp:Transcript_15601/g.20334  ORF Transcript_15601/g.20334 Transcript_15601/m.20334 type:complete len:102 (-) Transcript_15601:53-358(-)
MMSNTNSGVSNPSKFVFSFFFKDKLLSLLRYLPPPQFTFLRSFLRADGSTSLSSSDGTVNKEDSLNEISFMGKDAKDFDRPGLVKHNVTTNNVVVTSNFMD